MKKRKKQEKGITLIALVITIVVLIILATVSINMILNDNGIMDAAELAKGKYQNAAHEEEIELKNYLNKINEEIANSVEKISKEESYVGYYVDVDEKKGADAVIYADLAKGGSGSWGRYSDSYVIPTETNLKDYYISEESYTGVFGTKPVLKPMGAGNSRFLAMALEDFTTSYWYKKANGIQNYSSVTPEGVGKGEINTNTMIAAWNGKIYGEQDDGDVWKVIQAENKKGWYVPSSDEWLVFCDVLNITGNYYNLDTNIMTYGNYKEFGLSDYYWCSDLQHSSMAYCMGLDVSDVRYDGTFDASYNVRLGITI